MMIPILILVSVILFVLLRALPGDAALISAGETATTEDILLRRKEMGLDQSLYIQYLNWIGGVLHGDFGKSLISGSSISEKVSQRFPVTLELTILSMIFSVLFSIPLGILSALHRNTPLDYAASALSVFGLSMPSFWLGILMIILFSLNLGWLPAFGFVPITEDFFDSIRHLIMPAVSIGLSFAATTTRQTRNAMLEVMDQDYIMTAKAKGIPGKVVIWKHAFRNALIPVITVIAMQTGKLFGGSVIAETIFAIPGLGSEIVNSIMNRDYPITMAMVLIVAVIVIFVNTFIDIIYSVIDPRVGKD